MDWGNPDAPPIILQHGGRDHCRSWDWVAESLRHDWHVICPDLRGHGDSAWSPDGAYSMDAYVYDFTQLVETLGYGSVTICAHSMGGAIATYFSALYPDKVRKLANIEGLGPTPAFLEKRDALGFDNRLRTWIAERRKAAGRLPRRYPSIEAAFARMKAENGNLTDAQARHLTINGVSRNEDGTFSWKFDNYLNVWPILQFAQGEINKLWGQVECPVQLFYGTDSFATNPERDGRLGYFQNASVLEYENAGHWLHHDQFEQFMIDLKAFLAEEQA